MKKQRAFQVRIKEKQILKVAIEIFAEKGFKGATISQIAQAAKIAEGSIYYYFKDKEDILLSIPKDRMEDFLSGLNAHLKGIKGALNKLRKIIWYHLDFYERNKDYTRILLLDLRPNPRFIQCDAYTIIRQYSKVILQVIEEGKKEKTIRKNIDPFLVRDLILGGIEHFVIRGFIIRKFFNISEAADDFYDLILSGVAEENRMIALPLKKIMSMKGTKKGRPKITKYGGSN